MHLSSLIRRFTVSGANPNFRVTENLLKARFSITDSPGASRNVLVGIAGFRVGDNIAAQAAGSDPDLSLTGL